MKPGTMLAQPAIPLTAALQASIRSCMCWAWMYHSEVMPTDYGFAGRTELLFRIADFLPAAQDKTFDKDSSSVSELPIPNVSF